MGRDVTFDENDALCKARDLPPPPKEDDYDKDNLDFTSMPKLEDIDTPMEPMDPLDAPPSDFPSRKTPLWLCDTLQDTKRNIPIHRSFRERKEPCRY